MAQILIEEKMGFHVRTGVGTGRGSLGVLFIHHHHLYRSLAGFLRPTLSIQLGTALDTFTH